MSTHDTNQPNIGDSNVERLLGKAYHPEKPAPDLLPRVSQQMCEAARQPRPAKPMSTVQSASNGAAVDKFRIMPIFTGMAICLATLLVVFHALFPPPRSGSADR